MPSGLRLRQLVSCLVVSLQVLKLNMPKFATYWGTISFPLVYCWKPLQGSLFEATCLAAHDLRQDYYRYTKIWSNQLLPNDWFGWTWKPLQGTTPWAYLCGIQFGCRHAICCGTRQQAVAVSTFLVGQVQSERCLSAGRLENCCIWVVTD